MIGAVVLTFQAGGVSVAAMPFVVGILSGFVAWGRWRLVPHRATA